MFPIPSPRDRWERDQAFESLSKARRTMLMEDFFCSSARGGLNADPPSQRCPTLVGTSRCSSAVDYDRHIVLKRSREHDDQNHRNRRSGSLGDLGIPHREQPQGKSLRTTKRLFFVLSSQAPALLFTGHVNRTPSSGRDSCASKVSGMPVVR